MVYQIITFREFEGNAIELANKFLREKKDKVVSITTVYNTILGGLDFIITYYD